MKTVTQMRTLFSTPSLAKVLLAMLLVAGLALPAQAIVQQAIVGEVQFMTVQDPGDIWSRGVITVGGQNVIIPRNLLIDLPANRLTLQQLFAQAPAACLATGETGLAKGDVCNNLAHGASVSILANISDFGDVIAGDVFMPKAGEVGLGAGESISGNVTFIDHTEGYLRVNGIVGDPDTGVMVRINDPDGRHTIQQGLGCAGGPNCSADARYGLDPDNYTITFTTGYPACIPSTELGGNRTAGGNPDGSGDEFCPDTNRGTLPVPNSFLFAPIQLNDHIAAEGNFEIVNHVRFLSAHTLTVSAALTTSPGQPDYMTWDEVEWDVAGFQNERLRMLLIGFTTLPINVDVFALHVDPATNENNEFPIASTAGCEVVDAGDCLNQGIGAGGPGIFKVNYDVDFAAGVGGSPCTHLELGGFAGTCPGGATLDIAENFNVLSPISREVIGRSRNKTGNVPGGPDVIGPSTDIQGNDAPNGEYLTPVGVGHPEFVEIDLNRVQEPFIFAGEPWNLDRRLGPGGCDGPCDAVPVGDPSVRLDPFPYSALHPENQVLNFPPNSVGQVLSYFDSTGTQLPLPLPTAPPQQGIVPTPVVDLVCNAFVEDLRITKADYRTNTNRLVVVVVSNVGNFLTLDAVWPTGSGVVQFLNVQPNGLFRYRTIFTNVTDPGAGAEVTVTSDLGGIATRAINFIP